MVRRLEFLFLALLIPRGLGAFSSRQVSLPLKSDQNIENDLVLLKSAFQDVVDSTQFLVQTSQSEKDNSKCSIPVLGDNVVVQLRANEPSDGDSYSRQQSPNGRLSEFVLSVDSESDEFGFICLKFYENKELFQDIVDISNLHDVIIDHFERQPPHPGYHANTALLAGSREIEDLFQDTENAMLELEEKGFLILNNGPKSSTLGYDKLTKYLVEKTNQSSYVRRDTVHFLNRDEAKDCGLEHHFDTLMGIASFLNKNLGFRESPHLPVEPATHDQPLTIPDTVQLAEYGENDFYKAHSDNSLTDDVRVVNNNDDRIRNNFRHYTCILYCNDNWNEEDGGALRLYPNTRNLLNVDDAFLKGYDYIDVSPQNGKLIIFDSCLIHSVEKVMHKEKKRRALTLWINRPDDSGVKGETYF